MVDYQQVAMMLVDEVIGRSIPKGDTHCSIRSCGTQAIVRLKPPSIPHSHRVVGSSMQLLADGKGQLLINNEWSDGITTN